MEPGPGAGRRNRGKFIIPVPMCAGTGIIWSLCTSGPGLSPSSEINGAGARNGAAPTGGKFIIPVPMGAGTGIIWSLCTSGPGLSPSSEINGSGARGGAAPQGEVDNPGPDVRRDRDYLVPVYVGTGIITFVRDKWSRGPGRGGVCRGRHQN